jgi:hypothetical protein
MHGDFEPGLAAECERDDRATRLARVDAAIADDRNRSVADHRRDGNRFQRLVIGSDRADLQRDRRRSGNEVYGMTMLHDDVRDRPALHRHFGSRGARGQSQASVTPTRARDRARVGDFGHASLQDRECRLDFREQSPRRCRHADRDRAGLVNDDRVASPDADVSRLVAAGGGNPKSGDEAKDSGSHRESMRHRFNARNAQSQGNHR